MVHTFNGNSVGVGRERERARHVGNTNCRIAFEALTIFLAISVRKNSEYEPDRIRGNQLDSHLIFENVGGTPEK